MFKKDSNLEGLIKSLSKLPSLGRRSAERIALHLLNNKDEEMSPLINSLQTAINTVQHCQICNNLDSSNICSICSNANRDNNIICVVEQVADVWAIEKSGAFNGK